MQIGIDRLVKVGTLQLEGIHPCKPHGKRLAGANAFAASPTNVGTVCAFFTGCPKSRLVASRRFSEAMKCSNSLRPRGDEAQHSGRKASSISHHRHARSRQRM